jgi:DNA-binding phage protein/predicted RNase H-like HicB family nuclease
MTTAWDPAEHLTDEEAISAYLDAALELDDPELIAAALADVKRARTQIGRNMTIELTPFDAAKYLSDPDDQLELLKDVFATRNPEAIVHAIEIVARAQRFNGAGDRRQYYGIVHKDEGSAYGIHFPDLPGCFSAADLWKDLIPNAIEAMTLWFKDEPEVEPSAFEVIFELAREDLATGAIILPVPYP